ncbi:JAB domain-containing protein [Chondrinema litorale]|uniref:JAB domain-containing protein n=1 Tax=Chondrinema litorale TaxID=2994555 RepID=UPI002543C98B|nr:JAB domain-containing protein [Chondrinema litorale]UZR99984.1 JAB domain-containing protein [Chondrinema litorale]
MSKIKFDALQIPEIKISYSAKIPASQRPKVNTSAQAAALFRNHWDKDQLGFVESFKVMLFNRANRVLGIYTASIGGISGTVADPKLIFATALKSASCGILLCHNHPSGNLAPSQADINLTKKIKEAGKLLDIAVLDHIILTEENYFSFQDNGYF